jgi:hypothetical protein
MASSEGCSDGSWAKRPRGVAREAGLALGGRRLGAMRSARVVAGATGRVFGVERTGDVHPSPEPVAGAVAEGGAGVGAVSWGASCVARMPLTNW